MLYAIIATDRPDSLELRKRLRPQHLERLQALVAEGRLFAAGAFPAIDHADPGAAGFTGSLIVAEFDSLADAEAWIEQDPFVEQGIYAHVEVKPFRKALP